jgi:hypothetical protein
MISITLVYNPIEMGRPETTKTETLDRWKHISLSRLNYASGELPRTPTLVYSRLLSQVTNPEIYRPPSLTLRWYI